MSSYGGENQIVIVTLYLRDIFVVKFEKFFVVFIKVEYTSVKDQIQY